MVQEKKLFFTQSQFYSFPMDKKPLAVHTGISYFLEHEVISHIQSDITDREGANNQILGGPDGQRIIDLPGGKSMIPCQRNTILFRAYVSSGIAEIKCQVWQARCGGPRTI